MEMRSFFDNWYERFWVNEDMSAADDMTSTDVVVQGLTDAPQTTKEGLVDFAQALLAMCDFNDVTIKHFMQDDVWSHMLVQFKGTSRASGDPVNFDAQILAREVGGKIVEAYNHPDFMTLFQQTGMLPQDAIARCLSNKPLG